MPVGENEVSLKYKVVLKKSKEGSSVSCPGLPGCWSQGRTEEEALENIQDAIREYLEAAIQISKGAKVREVNEYKMGGIVRDAGLTVEEFKKLL